MRRLTNRHAPLSPLTPREIKSKSELNTVEKKFRDLSAEQIQKLTPAERYQHAQAASDFSLNATLSEAVCAMNPKTSQRVQQEMNTHRPGESLLITELTLNIQPEPEGPQNLPNEVDEGRLNFGGRYTWLCQRSGDGAAQEIIALNGNSQPGSGQRFVVDAVRTDRLPDGSIVVVVVDGSGHPKAAEEANSMQGSGTRMCEDSSLLLQQFLSPKDVFGKNAENRTTAALTAICETLIEQHKGSDPGTLVAMRIFPAKKSGEPARVVGLSFGDAPAFALYKDPSDNLRPHKILQLNQLGGAKGFRGKWGPFQLGGGAKLEHARFFIQDVPSNACVLAMSDGPSAPFTEGDTDFDLLLMGSTLNPDSAWRATRRLTQMAERQRLQHQPTFDQFTTLAQTANKYPDTLKPLLELQRTLIDAGQTVALSANPATLAKQLDRASEIFENLQCPEECTEAYRLLKTLQKPLDEAMGNPATITELNIDRINVDLEKAGIKERLPVNILAKDNLAQNDDNLRARNKVIREAIGPVLQAVTKRLNDDFDLTPEVRSRYAAFNLKADILVQIANVDIHAPQACREFLQGLRTPQDDIDPEVAEAIRSALNAMAPAEAVLNAIQQVHKWSLSEATHLSKQGDDFGLVAVKLRTN